MRYSKTIVSVVGLITLATGTLFCGSASATPSACDAIAGNILQNCGFETGTNSPWTEFSNQPGTSQGVNSNSNSGNDAWFISGYGTDQTPNVPHYDGVFQFFFTTPGTRYDVSFWAKSDGSLFNDTFAGYELFPFIVGSAVTPISNFNLAADAYAQYDYSFTANSLGAIVYFGGFAPFGAVQFDDFAVVKAPEPITLSLFGAGLAGAVAMRRRNKKLA